MSPGEIFAYVFSYSGTYAYSDTYGTAGNATIRVPLVVWPSASGNSATTFTLRWAGITPPTHLSFDVQIRRPARTFTNWVMHTKTRSRTFTPDAGKGSYAFRARLHSATGARSAWSPTITLNVT